MTDPVSSLPNYIDFSHPDYVPGSQPTQKGIPMPIGMTSVKAAKLLMKAARGITGVGHKSKKGKHGKSTARPTGHKVSPKIGQSGTRLR